MNPARKPRVCLLTETYYPVVGGGETQARALAEELAAQGFGVLVITRRSDAALHRREQIGPVAVYRLSPAGPAHLKKWGLLLTSGPALLRHWRRYDVLLVSGFRVVGVTAVLAGKLLGKPCILKADSLGEMSGDFFADGLAQLRLNPSSFIFKSFLWLRNRILKHANAFIAISSEVTEELVNHGISPSLIRTIPNSVDTSRFCPVGDREKHELRRKLRLSPKDKVVTFTGRLVSYKGLPLLLRVWQEIQRKHDDARLLLVGSGGLDIHNCEAELKEYVNANGLSENVRFMGSVRNVHEYLQASDIFVFPTENEAFGISLIEAMACGLPVISTSVGGVRDILEHRKNGLVVEVNHFQQLYDALDTLMTDTALSTCLGQAARQVTREKYSAEIVTRQYVELFRHFFTHSTKLPRWAS